MPLVSPLATDSLVRHTVISVHRELKLRRSGFGQWHKLHTEFYTNFSKASKVREREGPHRHTKSGDSIGLFFFVFRKENRVESETKRCHELGMRLIEG